MVKNDEIDFTGGYNLLMLKAEEGNIEEVLHIIYEMRHIDINAVNKKGYTALSLAVKAGHTPVVGLLIEAGGNPNIRNNSGQSPLFLACWNNHEELVKLLLDYGADINEVDHRGWTSLMIAAYHGHRQTVKELLARNADRDIQDLFGKRAWDRAKDPNIIRMLEGGVYSYRSSSPTQSEGKKSHSLSNMKKSNSKASMKANKIEHTQSFVASGASSSGLPKSSNHSTVPKRLTEPRRNSNHSNNFKQSEINSAEKSLDALKHVISDAISPIKHLNASKNLSSSYTLERQLYKDDLEKLLNEQLRTIKHKIQHIVEQKVSLDIPMHIQGVENELKSQLESILQFKTADIFKNLTAIFNLKLKFCLTRLGYDTANLGMNTFLEEETDYVAESIAFTREPAKTYDKKEFKAIEHDLDRLEKSIISSKTTNQNILRGSHRDCSPVMSGGFQCDHTTQLHRTEIKNDLLDHLGGEVRSTTEYLLDYSNSRVNEIAREESGSLYKRLVTEVTRNMEALESELKNRFEAIIAEKLDKITEVIGHDVSHRKERMSASSSKAKKEMRDSKLVSPDMTRDSVPAEKREYESKARSQESSQTKDRIQRIKNSLNFMDEDGETKQPPRMLQSISISKHYEEDVPEEVQEEPEEEYIESARNDDPEIERIYNPDYRSVISQEKSAPQQPQSQQYQLYQQHSSSVKNSNKKPEVNHHKESYAKNAKMSQPAQQSRHTSDSKKAGKSSGSNIPRHQFVMGGNSDQGVNYYNFANE